MLLQISSGQGPIECEYFVGMLANALVDEYEEYDMELTTAFLDLKSGGICCKSAILYCPVDMPDIEGTMQWIWQSKFRPNHKRKNWFVDVSIIPEIEDIETRKSRKITIKTTHSGGPGGQNVNKVESAVTIIDEETGIKVESREERSQYANKKKALIKLYSILDTINTDNKANQKNTAWRKHTQIVRGNPIRVYKGDKFERVK